MAQSVELGVMFPGDQVGLLSNDDLDRWVRAVSGAGYRYITMGDHVLGVDAAGLDDEARAEWMRRWPGPYRDPYTHRHAFREPLITFAYLAGRCDLHFATGVLVLPQRQTAVVAKQAAEVDLYSGGRLRLGVGTGWSPLEYAALGASFEARVRMLEEQIVLLRLLWTEEAVDFHGEFHNVVSAGIQTLPVQRPIPIWLGGGGPKTLRRIGRLADGWNTPSSVAAVEAPQRLAVIHDAATAAGRDPEAIAIEPRLYSTGRGRSEVQDFVGEWNEMGATHVLVNTSVVGASPVTIDEHCDRLRAAAASLS